MHISILQGDNNGRLQTLDTRPMQYDSHTIPESRFVTIHQCHPVFCIISGTLGSISSWRSEHVQIGRPTPGRSQHASQVSMHNLLERRPHCRPLVRHLRPRHVGRLHQHHDWRGRLQRLHRSLLPRATKLGQPINPVFSHVQDRILIDSKDLYFMHTWQYLPSASNNSNVKYVSKLQIC